jgi:hypothetical protein
VGLELPRHVFQTVGEGELLSALLVLLLGITFEGPALLAVLASASLHALMSIKCISGVYDVRHIDGAGWWKPNAVMLLYAVVGIAIGVWWANSG